MYYGRQEALTGDPSDLVIVLAYLVNAWIALIAVPDVMD